MRTCVASQVLLATLIAQSTALIPFGPVFPVSQYDTSEGQQLMVHLSAPFLIRDEIPPFDGSIEVDIIAEDLPSGDSRHQAESGSDYTVSTQDPQSNKFTVTFKSKQSSSSGHPIQISDDSILEGREYFRLRISAVRFIGSAAQLFLAQDAVDKTSVDVSIENDDFVQVNWTISQAISVTEGDTVVLRAEVFGVYAFPIAIGVKTIATDVQPALPNKDFNFTIGTKLHFTDVGTSRSLSNDQIVIPIVNDDIAEPRESFICNLQGDSVNSVQVAFPNQVTIQIVDDDQLIVRWGKDFYEFTEGDLVTEVELVTDSNFEVEQISIQGFPRQIPERHSNHISSLVVPGPVSPVFAFDASIERVQFRGTVFGNAQVIQAGRTDVQRSTSDFTFKPAIKSAFHNFTIVDDDVLEFDELFIAEFDFGPQLSKIWNVNKGEPSVLFCLIRDDDFVEVNFNKESYAVIENEGQVSISLRITGKFFIPVYAIVEVSDGTATDPEDYTGARKRYNVTFPQTAYTDQEDPASFAVSLPISINITDDDSLEDVEYFQARIVETSDRFRVKIGQRDTVNVTITEEKIKARAVTPDGPVEGRVTETLKIKCEAQVNSDDTDVTFTWKTGDVVLDTTTVRATNGMATAEWVICELSLEKHHNKTVECHPSNAFGKHNFTRFEISVKLFPPPVITKFRFQPDSKDAIDVEWLPVNVTRHPFVLVEAYYIELARDKDGSSIEARDTVTGGKASHIFSVGDCSNRYWVRIKAVISNNQDISSFSSWVPVEPVSCPVIVPAEQTPIPGWVIFLIVLPLILLCFLIIFVIFCLLLCYKKKRKPKGVYKAEKREDLYQADRPEIQAQESSVASDENVEATEQADEPSM